MGESRKHPAVFSTNERWFVAKLGADVWKHIILEFLLPARRTQYRKAWFLGAVRYEMLVGLHLYEPDYGDRDEQTRMERIQCFADIFDPPRWPPGYVTDYALARTIKDYKRLLFPSPEGLWKKVGGRWYPIPSGSFAGRGGS